MIMKTKADHRNKIRKIKKKASISTDHFDYSRKEMLEEGLSLENSVLGLSMVGWDTWTDDVTTLIRCYPAEHSAGRKHG